MERPSVRPAASEHDLALSRPVGLGRHDRAHSRGSLRSEPRERRSRAQSDDSYHRRTERQGRRRRGRSLDPCGYDAGKKILGRKRHILVDTLGLLLNVDDHAASIQDRDGVETLLRQARRRFPVHTARHR
ncbi:transposase [Acidisoma cladoniae]|uniref:transposase n=1 Tax=Acidisoma cladoniae TaxID=3040935 RepID=UPI0033135164